MAGGIIIKDGSTGATQEGLKKLLESQGYEEVETTEEGAEPVVEETSPPAKEVEETEEEQELLEATEPKKKSKFQKRIEKLLRPYEQTIADLRKQLEGKPKTEEPKAEQNPEPKRADFKTDEEFDEAKFQFRYQRQRAADAAKEAKEHERELLEGFLKNYNEDKARAADEYEDFTDVVGSSEVRIHNVVQMAIYECQKPADIVYYLAKNPDYAEKLYEMTPLSAVKEVGRLEKQLSKAESGKPGSGTGSEEQPKPKPRVLPPPIRPISTAATTSTLTSRDAATKGDFAAFKAARKAGR